jgi:hypothetical protein
MVSDSQEHDTGVRMDRGIFEVCSDWTLSARAFTIFSSDMPDLRATSMLLETVGAMSICLAVTPPSDHRDSFQCCMDN